MSMKLFAALAAMTLALNALPASAEDSLPSRLEAVTIFADTALKEGRYVENSAASALFVDGINIDTREPVVWRFNGEEYWPSNLANQQIFMRTLTALTNLSGDSRYKEVAKQQYEYYFDSDNGYGDKNGLLYWGGHRLINMKNGRVTGEQHVHEFKHTYPFWDMMYEINPEKTLRYIEAYWNAHVDDWSTLSFNRHGVYDAELGDVWNNEYSHPESWDFVVKGLPFGSAGANLCYAAIKYSQYTGNKAPLQWVSRMQNQYLMSRHPETGLGGFQYGLLAAGDRAQIQYGEDFGDAAVEAWAYIRSSSIQSYYGDTIGAQVVISDMLGDKEQAMDFADGFDAFVEYMYDFETGKAEPMFADGSSVVGYTPKIDGYYGMATMGMVGLQPGVFNAGVICYESNRSQKIWDCVRNIGKDSLIKIGDIGSAPGVDVALDFTSAVTDPESIYALLKLYDISRCEDYLEMAKHIGNNIIQYHFKGGLFVESSRGINAKFDSADPYALLLVEAYERGTPELVPPMEIFSEGYIHWSFDENGVSKRTYDNNAIYSKARRNPTGITLDKSGITLSVGENPGFSDTVGHWAQDDITEMKAKGIISGSGGVFEPNENVTRAEFLSMLNRLAGFGDQEAEHRFNDINESDWYADAVYSSYNAGIIDSELYSGDRIHPNEPLTREETASFAVRTLRKKAADKAYAGRWYITKFDDGQEAGHWAKEYINTVCTTGIMRGINDHEFAPKKTVTRAEAAAILKRLEQLITNTPPTLTATIQPDDATNKKVIFTTDNKNVVLVDKHGNLTPVAPGSATITATVADVSAACDVTVIPAVQDALSSIRIDGNILDGFTPEVYEYDYHCIAGTTRVPLITAAAYRGDAKISYPNMLPGAVTIKTDAKTYTVNIIADRNNYYINEEFENYQSGLAGTSQATAGYAFTSPEYNRAGGTSPITVENRDDGAGGKHLFFPVDISKTRVRQINYNTDKAIDLGMESDEYQLVFQADFKFDNANTANSIMNIYDYELAPIMRLGLAGGRMTYVGSDGSSQPVYNFADKLDEYFSFKLVLDKRTRRVDIYINDQLVLANRDMLNPSAESLKRITLQAGYNCLTNMWIDNFKLYDAVVDMAEEVTLEPDAEAEKKFTPVDISFDDYEIFANANKQKGWITAAVNTEGTANPVTIEKRLFAFGLKDLALCLPGVNQTAPAGRMAKYTLPAPVMLGIEAEETVPAVTEAYETENADGESQQRPGEAEDRGKLVFEFEAYIGGSGAGISIALADASDTNIVYFNTTNASMRYYSNGTESVRIYDEGEEMPGHKMYIKYKTVIDIKDGSVDLYKNGEYLDSGTIYNNPSGAQIAAVKISAAEAVKVPVYIDNIKLYIERNDDL